MKSAQLKACAQRSANNLLALFEENEDDILKAIHAMEEEAQNSEADKCIVTFSHAIKLDLTGKAQRDSLSFSVKTKLETVASLPDPEQPELPIEA